MIDILNRKNAPISQEVWEEIDERAKEVIKSYLSARKTLHVVGPKGWDYTAVEEGRLGKISDYNDHVKYASFLVKPLVEARVEFEMDRFELDNLRRGAKDIDYKPLEDAVKEMALFEENVIYKGLEEGKINGLLNDSDKKVIKLSQESEEIVDAISEGMIQLREAFVDKPYTLVVGSKVWKLINRHIKGTDLLKKIENILESKVVYSHVLEGALLLPYDHEDLELTIGQDFTIDYQGHDHEKIKFYVTESFTYRTLDKDIIIQYNL